MHSDNSLLHYTGRTGCTRPQTHRHPAWARRWGWSLLLEGLCSLWVFVQPPGEVWEPPSPTGAGLINGNQGSGLSQI